MVLFTKTLIHLCGLIRLCVRGVLGFHFDCVLQKKQHNKSVLYHEEEGMKDRGREGAAFNADNMVTRPVFPSFVHVCICVCGYMDVEGGKGDSIQVNGCVLMKPTKTNT